MRFIFIFFCLFFFLFACEQSKNLPENEIIRQDKMINIMEEVVVISQEKSPIVTKENCLYSCAWSPFEGIQFSHTIEKTFVNGNVVFQDGIIVNDIIGERLTFKT